jgi:hypothetical protein
MKVKNGLIFKNMPCPFYAPEKDVECKRGECPAYQSCRRLTDREIRDMNAADIPVMSTHTNTGYCTKYGIDEYIIVDSEDGNSLWKEQKK